MKSITISK